VLSAEPNPSRPCQLAELPAPQSVASWRAGTRDTPAVVHAACCLPHAACCMLRCPALPWGRRGEAKASQPAEVRRTAGSTCRTLLRSMPLAIHLSQSRRNSMGEGDGESESEREGVDEMERERESDSPEPRLLPTPWLRRGIVRHCHPLPLSADACRSPLSDLAIGSPMKLPLPPPASKPPHSPGEVGHEHGLGAPRNGEEVSGEPRTKPPASSTKQHPPGPNHRAPSTSHGPPGTKRRGRGRRRRSCVHGPRRWIELSDAGWGLRPRLLPQAPSSAALTEKGERVDMAARTSGDVSIRTSRHRNM
jgi:hypothetical protein